MNLHKQIMGNETMTESEITKKQKICIQCQNCCKYITFLLPAEGIRDLFDYYRKRGLSVEEIKGGPWKGYHILEIYYPCPHLTEQGCNIYADRPKVCRDYNGLADVTMREKCMWLLLDKEESNLEEAIDETEWRN